MTSIAQVVPEGWKEVPSRGSERSSRAAEGLCQIPGRSSGRSGSPPSGDPVFRQFYGLRYEPLLGIGVGVLGMAVLRFRKTLE